MARKFQQHPKAVKYIIDPLAGPVPADKLTDLYDLKVYDGIKIKIQRMSNLPEDSNMFSCQELAEAKGGHYRPLEDYIFRRDLTKTIKANWARKQEELEAQRVEEAKRQRSLFVRALNEQHKRWMVGARAIVQTINTLEDLYAFADVCAQHDLELYAKAGRDFANSFAELEKEVRLAEQRIAHPERAVIVHSERVNLERTSQETAKVHG